MGSFIVNNFIWWRTFLTGQAYNDNMFFRALKIYILCVFHWNTREERKQIFLSLLSWQKVSFLMGFLCRTNFVFRHHQFATIRFAKRVNYCLKRGLKGGRTCKYLYIYQVTRTEYGGKNHYHYSTEKCWVIRMQICRSFSLGISYFFLPVKTEGSSPH